LSERADANHFILYNQSIKYCFLKVRFSLKAVFKTNNGRTVKVPHLTTRRPNPHTLRLLPLSQMAPVTILLYSRGKWIPPGFVEAL